MVHTFCFGDRVLLDSPAGLKGLLPHPSPTPTAYSSQTELAMTCSTSSAARGKLLVFWHGARQYHSIILFSPLRLLIDSLGRSSKPQ